MSRSFVETLQKISNAPRYTQETARVPPRSALGIGQRISVHRRMGQQVEVEPEAGDPKLRPFADTLRPLANTATALGLTHTGLGMAQAATHIISGKPSPTLKDLHDITGAVTSLGTDSPLVRILTMAGPKALSAYVDRRAYFDKQKPLKKKASPDLAIKSLAGLAVAGAATNMLAAGSAVLAGEVMREKKENVLNSVRESAKHHRLKPFAYTQQPDSVFRSFMAPARLDEERAFRNKARVSTGPVEAIALHELGHHKDYQNREYKPRMWMSMVQKLPDEYRASEFAVKELVRKHGPVKGLLKATPLLPAFGSYVGAGAMDVATLGILSGISEASQWNEMEQKREMVDHMNRRQAKKKKR